MKKTEQSAEREGWAESGLANDPPLRAVRAFEAAGCSRAEALRRMVEAYAERMHANVPVHAWEMP